MEYVVIPLCMALLAYVLWRADDYEEATRAGYVRRGQGRD